MDPLEEARLRVAERLHRDGWNETMDLEEAVVSDPEYVAAVRRTLPPLHPGNAEQQRLRRQEVQRILDKMNSID